METKIMECVDRRRQELIDFAKDIYRHPEAGFCEFRTASRVRDFWRGWGLRSRRSLPAPGCAQVCRAATAPI